MEHPISTGGIVGGIHSEMIDEYFINTQILLIAIYMVIPSVVIGVLVSKFKKTKTDKRLVIAGLCGVAASSLLFFGTVIILTPPSACCETDMSDSNKIFLSSLRLLSTPFALISTCFFYRGLSERFNRTYIAETSILLLLVWTMLIFM